MATAQLILGQPTASDQRTRLLMQHGHLGGERGVALVVLAHEHLLVLLLLTVALDALARDGAVSDDDDGAAQRIQSDSESDAEQDNDSGSSVRAIV